MVRLNPAHPAPPGAQPRRGTLLLAEDDPILRPMLARVLHLEGYHVLEAKDGIEALELAGSGPGTIDALVTDLVMPGLGGLDLDRELRRHQPRLRTLFMSGYPVENLGTDDADAPRLLQKPFLPQHLVAAVDALLVG